MNTLQERLEEAKDLESDIPKALKEAFVSTDEALKLDPRIDAQLSGTTAVVCVVVVHRKEKKMVIYTANVGDSRAIVGEERNGKLIAYPLSSDQTPFRKDERERVTRQVRDEPRPLLCRCVVAPPRILSLTKCRRPLSSHICTCLLSAPAGKASPCRLHTRGCQ
mgnify:CR=1 FL=1